MSGYLDEKKTKIFIKHLYKQRKYFSNSWKKDFIKQELLIAYIYIYFYARGKQNDNINYSKWRQVNNFKMLLDY